MIHAYDKLYLASAMDTMGAMMDCAANCYDTAPELFHLMFLASGIDREIEKGNPRFIAGVSGSELALMVLGDNVLPSTEYKVNFGREYWTGWVLCLLQWETGMRFKDLELNGMDISTVMNLYPTLHEADTQKFLDVAKQRIQTARDASPTRLKTLRKASGLTQEQLAQLSGTSLRAIQSYEQRYLDISKAEGQSIGNIAKVLGCSIEDLIQG